ncbi:MULTISPECIES: LysE family translocator [Microbacterium]|uniref:Lysine transporter LysE n=1 Tax=Microbacterium maritypicum TaxID=33918 RepID=A0A4Y4B2A9_MICMQ|nr:MULTISPECIES: LysE family transporter [Microbacterium]AZS47270.1 Homoserine/homoserine lactone efflux protein [Microbacterium oxydans]KAB1887304.1 lysine transporter LysE [Microbacterium liquefaciens]KQY76317.1 lysine transporter LysE [Microbacterium sp. Root1433D1]QYG10906.1 LysE family transporter [Microbacterium sp. PAMC22086]WKT88783.1 LysE family transporter [Microbacterium liquefaciens]
MSLAVWFSLLTASVVISFTPGAGAINTMSNAMNQGWRRSIWGIVGQQIALIVHVAVVAAGVGLLVSRSEVLFNGIRYAGAAYLVFLGIRLILTKPAVVVDDVPVPVDSRESHWSMIRRGFWVNLLNPKAIVFFLAFIPQFVRLDEPPLPQYLTLIVTVIVVDVIVMWGFFAAAARPFRRLTRTARGQRVLNTVFGALFIVVAAILVLLH